MAKRCGSTSEDHRRKVGEGVSRAWRKRYGDGFRPKSPAGQAKWIARFLHTDDPIWAVQFLEESHRRMCNNIQECIHKHNLGLGGEFIDQLLIEEYELLRERIEALQSTLKEAESLLATGANLMEELGYGTCEPDDNCANPDCESARQWKQQVSAHGEASRKLLEKGSES